MKRKDDKALLKEYVSQILKEDDYGVDALGGADYSTGVGMGGLGWGPYGSPGVLYKAFVKPFVDIVGVTVGKTKELARRTITLLQVAFEAIMTALIPILTDSYDEIFAKEASDVQKIRDQYNSYYQASDEALGGGAMTLALLAFPGPTLLAKTLRDGPRAAQAVLSVATGGLSDEYLSGGGGGRKSGGPKGSGIFDSHMRKYSKIILEDDDKKENTLAKKLASKKVINSLISRSPMMSAAAKDAQEIFWNTLDNAYEQAKQVLTARSVDAIEKFVGKKIEGTDELNKLSGAEKSNAEQELLKTIKKSAKEMYVARLTLEMKPVAEAFGDDHPFVTGYKETIDKIRSL